MNCQILLINFRDFSKYLLINPHNIDQIMDNAFKGDFKKVLFELLIHNLKIKNFLY
jgi:hypothetical protein